MEREQLTHHELNAALRSAGVSCIEEVITILENTGKLQFIRKSVNDFRAPHDTALSSLARPTEFAGR